MVVCRVFDVCIYFAFPSTSPGFTMEVVERRGKTRALARSNRCVLCPFQLNAEHVESGQCRVAHNQYAFSSSFFPDESGRNATYSKYVATLSNNVFTYAELG